jgi:hypothetical protein
MLLRADLITVCLSALDEFIDKLRIDILPERVPEFAFLDRLQNIAVGALLDIRDGKRKERI